MGISEWLLISDRNMLETELLSSGAPGQAIREIEFSERLMGGRGTFLKCVLMRIAIDLDS